MRAVRSRERRSRRHRLLAFCRRLPVIPIITQPTSLAFSIAASTFGELPLVLIAISTSPLTAKASTCRAKYAQNRNRSLAPSAPEVSVVNAMLGKARRFFHIGPQTPQQYAVHPLPLPPFPQSNTLLPLRNAVQMISPHSAIFGISSATICSKTSRCAVSDLR